MKQRYTVIALFTAILVDALGWGIAFPALVPIVINNTAGVIDPSYSLATRNFLYELSLGIYCIFMFFMSPILGSLSDKYGRKKILVLSMFGNFLGFLISSIAISLHSFTGILIGRSIAGATAGSLPIAQAAMIDISDESQKASRLGLVILANVAGFAVGPVIGGFFMDTSIFGNAVNYQTPFLISSAMGFLGALLLMFCFKETFQGNKEIKINLLTSFKNLHEAFTSKNTYILCIVLSFFLLGWAMFFSMMPILLTEKLSWSGSAIGYFITYIAAIFAVVILFVMSKINQKYSLYRVIFVSLSCLFVCNLLFPITYNSIYPWMVILLTIAVPFTYVGTVTLLSTRVDNQNQGKLMGITGSIYAFTWGVGPLLAGVLLKASLLMPYLLIGISFGAALLLFKNSKKSY